MSIIDELRVNLTPPQQEQFLRVIAAAKADGESRAREEFARQIAAAVKPSAASASFRFLINRLREPKTYIGLVALAGVVGITRPDLDMWILGAAGLFTFIAGLLPEVGATDEKRSS